MEAMASAMSIAFVFAFLAFGMWLRQQRRVMIHRERLAALDKGLDPPPLERESYRINWNVQRLLLLAGLVWISIGVGFYLVFNSIVSHPIPATADLPNGLQYAGVGMVGIGLSHLIAYAVGRDKEV